MNFALILFLLTLATGVLWTADHFHFRKQRVADAKEPVWVEYGASFFPVILAVFFLRSFLFEPFKIPSGSMLPTLLVGDFILVNKYTYGIRLPVINKKIVEINSPKRGDVVVFRYPVDPSLDYIKRIVGLPGDKVAYQNKRLTINGKPMPMQVDGDFFDKERLFYTPRFVEKLDDVSHAALNDAEAPTFVSYVMQYPNRDKCIYNSEGFICDVPPGHYFAMGDNRDNSQDSRVWGFVPDENLVGKAFLIWFNFSDLKRIGSFR
jgi:signal peptidase I